MVKNLLDPIYVDGQSHSQNTDLGQDSCYQLASWIWMMPELTHNEKRPTPRHDVFESAVKPHLPRLFRFCLALTTRRDTADDLFQNALIKAYTRFDSFSGQGELASWLCGIARNEYLEFRRTSTRRSALLERVMQAWSSVYGAIPGAGHGPLAPDAELDRAESRSLFLECLKHIAAEHREVIVLCDVESMHYEEVAAILSVPVGTVKSRHARGRAKLRDAAKHLGLDVEDIVLKETLT